MEMVEAALVVRPGEPTFARTLSPERRRYVAEAFAAALDAADLLRQDSRPAASGNDATRGLTSAPAGHSTDVRTEPRSAFGTCISRRRSQPRPPTASLAPPFPAALIGPAVADRDPADITRPSAGSRAGGAVRAAESAVFNLPLHGSEPGRSAPRRSTPCGPR